MPLRTMNMKSLLPPAPLSSFAPGDGELEIVEVLGLDGPSRRMCELGICPGRKLTLVRNGNPAIVALSGGRFALSAELAARVFVRPAA
jgi:Fe2+ transport system protein FeoA